MGGDKYAVSVVAASNRMERGLSIGAVGVGLINSNVSVILSAPVDGT